MQHEMLTASGSEGSAGVNSLKLSSCRVSASSWCLHWKAKSFSLLLMISSTMFSSHFRIKQLITQKYDKHSNQDTSSLHRGCNEDYFKLYSKVCTPRLQVHTPTRLPVLQHTHTPRLLVHTPRLPVHTPRLPVLQHTHTPRLPVLQHTYT